MLARRGRRGWDDEYTGLFLASLTDPNENGAFWQTPAPRFRLQCSKNTRHTRFRHPTPGHFPSIMLLADMVYSMLAD